MESVAGKLPEKNPSHPERKLQAAMRLAGEVEGPREIRLSHQPFREFSPEAYLQENPSHPERRMQAAMRLAGEVEGPREIRLSHQPFQGILTTTVD